MPWVWVGNFCLDLLRVEYVARQAGPGGGVTIHLMSGATIDLGGAEAQAFLAAWDEHAAAKPIARAERPERGPPAVLIPRLIVPDDSGHPQGRVEGGVGVGNSSGDHH